MLPINALRKNYSLALPSFWWFLVSLSISYLVALSFQSLPQSSVAFLSPYVCTHACVLLNLCLLIRTSAIGSKVHPNPV